MNGEPVQDGMLQHFLELASSSDANVEARISSEPFFLQIKNDGTSQHNIRDAAPAVTPEK